MPFDGHVFFLGFAGSPALWFYFPPAPTHSDYLGSLHIYDERSIFLDDTWVGVHVEGSSRICALPLRTQIADYIIASAGIAGLVFSWAQYSIIAKTTIEPQPTTERSGLRDIDAKRTENL